MGEGFEAQSRFDPSPLAPSLKGRGRIRSMPE
jgi:hypothetical protein